MESAGATDLYSSFSLTPEQQQLLFTALENRDLVNSFPVNQTSASFTNPPGSQLLDIYYNIGDTNCDASVDPKSNLKSTGSGNVSTPSITQSQLIDGDNPDKRSHPDDDDEEEGGTYKKREDEGKLTKKTGRKSMTIEPSSKRKAQNRAAQRAFRERKEKHLKDLETKVEVLEKASENASTENGILRAKLDRVTNELNEYKKRLSSMTARAPLIHPHQPWGASIMENINDVNFQFEFPKFGSLPDASAAKNSDDNLASISTVPIRQMSDQLSPCDKSSKDVQSFNSKKYSATGLDALSSENSAKFPTGILNMLVPIFSHGSHTSTKLSSSPATNENSSSCSSSLNMGDPSSSCGTSPEPIGQSPVRSRPIDTLTTIGEENYGLTSKTLADNSRQLGKTESSNMSWMPPSNFQFDPQLFGEFRKYHDSLSTGCEETLNDAFETDFSNPYNMPPSIPPVSETKPMNHLTQIGKAKESDEPEPQPNVALITCSKNWEKLQQCPRVQNGDFDLDSLCSDLQKKAKCSASGAVIDESHLNNVMRKYFKKKDEEPIEPCSLYSTNPVV